MGLFDTLHCDRPLPDGCTEREFQTKSLACEMGEYRLSGSGRLLHHDGQDTGFHGVMRFYTLGAAGSWHEYEAMFTRGALQHLVPVADAAYSPEGMSLPLPPAQP